MKLINRQQLPTKQQQQIKKIVSFINNNNKNIALLFSFTFPCIYMWIAMWLLICFTKFREADAWAITRKLKQNIPCLWNTITISYYINNQNIFWWSTIKMHQYYNVYNADYATWFYSESFISRTFLKHKKWMDQMDSCFSFSIYTQQKQHTIL